MADLHAEMTAYLTKLNDGGTQGVESVDTSVVTENDKQGENESVDASKDEGDSETIVEPSETETEESESADEQGSKEVEDKKAVDKRPNRYQRLKKRVEEAESKFTKLQKESTENHAKLLKVAHAWRAEAIAFEQELKKTVAKASKLGLVRSPEDEQLFLHSRESMSRKAQDQLQGELEKEEVKTSQEQVKANLVRQFQEDALDLVEKYDLPKVGNVDPAKKLLALFHAERVAGNNVTMEDVAKTLSEYAKIKSKKAAQDEQFENSQNAPIVKVKKSGGKKVDYPPTTDGMAAFLKASGLG